MQRSFSCVFVIALVGTLQLQVLSYAQVVYDYTDPSPQPPRSLMDPASLTNPVPAYPRVQSPPHVAQAVNFMQSDDSSDTSIQLIVGRGRILTTEAPVSKEGDVAVIAIGDPTVADFEVLPNPRMLRLIGKRPGITDLTVVTSDEKTLMYELHVQYDLSLIQAQLRRSFPGANVWISQPGGHLVLEGQAREPRQVVLIEQTVRAILDSMLPPNSRGGSPRLAGQPPSANGPDQGDYQDESALGPTLRALAEPTIIQQAGDIEAPQIINLITVPGVQQVLLQVRVAELNRTGLREIGGDSFFEWGPGNILGTRISSGTASREGLQTGANSTVFGVFPSARIEFVLRALRQNSLLRVLAEPNLVALSGHEASFLAGGEFPVPVPQGTTGGTGNVTVRFKEFGVQLNFVPYILDDDVIRLEVRPEVSTIDESLGTTLVVGGDPVPGVNTRRVHTTVQLREGEALALAGLLQITLDANTARVPLLGDLPYLGPFFSNTTHKRVEKELLVIVTPYLVSPLTPHEVPPLPGEEIQDPNDLEFYLLNRIEGVNGRTVCSGINGDVTQQGPQLMKLHKAYVSGPVGFTQPVRR